MTLTDILGVIQRRRLLVAVTFTVIFLGSVALTAATPPVYEARVTLLALNEREALITILKTDAYRADVAALAGPLDAVQHVDVTTTQRARGDPNENVVTITVTALDAASAARVANAYVATLDDWRPTLERVTYARNWETYYEDARKNGARARSELGILTSEMDYYFALDEAATPQEPIRPDWTLNLALGAAIGALLGLLLPFLVEGVLRAFQGPGARAARNRG